MKMNGANPWKLLATPRIEEIREAGQLAAVYVQVRDSEPTYAERPRDDLGVFIYCDNDGLPVGVKFFEPVPCVILVELIETLLTGADGRPEAMGTIAKNHVVTIAEIHATLNAVKTAVKALPQTIVPCGA